MRDIGFRPLGFNLTCADGSKNSWFRGLGALGLGFNGFRVYCLGFTGFRVQGLGFKAYFPSYLARTSPHWRAWDLVSRVQGY